MRRLTRAVYRAAQAPAESEKRVLRILPSPLSVLALVLLLMLLALIGIVRAQLPGNAQAIDVQSAGSTGAGAGGAATEEQSAHVGGRARDGGESTAAPTPAPTKGPSISAGRVIVHVAGAVDAPGVVDLPLDSRVVDAIGAAGGPLAEADLDALNLARRLSDGERILVPRIGEAAPTGTGHGKPGEPAAAEGGASCVDVRTADAAALEDLDGIGPRLAQRIIAFRDSSGPFESVDDLDAVPGIGPALLARIREGACP